MTRPFASRFAAHFAAHFAARTGAALRALVAVLLPAACARCGRALEDALLCARCDAALPRLDAADASLLGLAPPLAACLAAAPFEAEVATWVRRFKYPPPGLAGLDPRPQVVLEHLLLEAAAQAPEPPPDAVVPVPLHPARLRQRGFNPAALLGRSLARERGLHFAPGLLVRVRDTPSQTGLDRSARRQNVAGAFRARGPLPGLCVWLVDDVVTTGSTLAAAARALGRAGAHRVVALAVARTPDTR